MAVKDGLWAVSGVDTGGSSVVCLGGSTGKGCDVKFPGGLGCISRTTQSRITSGHPSGAGEDITGGFSTVCLHDNRWSTCIVRVLCPGLGSVIMASLLLRLFVFNVCG